MLLMTTDANLINFRMKMSLDLTGMSSGIVVLSTRLAYLFH